MDEEASPEELGKLLVDVKNAGLQPTDEALTDLGERLGFPVERQAPAPDPFGSQRNKPTEETESEGETEAESETESKTETESVTSASPRNTQHATGFRLPDATALAAAYKGSMAPFRQAIQASTSRADCLLRLERLYADWQPARLAAELDNALQLCSAQAAANSTK